MCEIRSEATVHKESVKVLYESIVYSEKILKIDKIVSF